MIVLRTPKGWTGPEGGRRHPGRGHLALAPGAARRRAREPGAPAPARGVAAELPAGGALRRRRARSSPSSPRSRRTATRRMSANPHANGGELLRDLGCPTSATTRSTCRRRATTSREATRVLGTFLRDVIARNPDNFRLFGPDETASNRLGAVFEATDQGLGRRAIEPTDEHLAPDGRVMEVLSEHLCQGWLEGYLLTGRHGLFNCYEAFIHIVDSMFNQHAKWLKVTREIPWRRPIASLNYLLSLARLAPGPQRLLAPGPRLHRPRREQEGRGHPRLPAAGREHPALGRRPLPAQSRHYVNVIVAGKQPALDYLSMDDAIVHCTRGARHLGVGLDRRGRRARRRARLLRRRPDARDARRRGDPARAAARAEGARRQRRRPDAAAARDRASARAVRHASSTRSSRPTGRSSSPTTATRG